MEVWKDVVGYEGWYSVSSFGRIRRDMPSPGTMANRILKPILSYYGYYIVKISISGKVYPRSVASLVVDAFINSDNKYGTTINHKDGIKTNNHVDNLERIPNFNNMKHASNMGLLKIRAFILNEEIVKNIRLEYYNGYNTQKELATKYRVCQSNIWNIVNNKTWKHIALF